MPEYRRTYIPGGSYFLTLLTYNRTPLFQVLVGWALPTIFSDVVSCRVGSVIIKSPISDLTAHHFFLQFLSGAIDNRQRDSIFDLMIEDRRFPILPPAIGRTTIVMLGVILSEITRLQTLRYS